MHKQADFFDNIGGLNTSDSPFFVQNNQATGGFNYLYPKTGGVQKIRGATSINTVADSQLNTLGLGLHNTSSGVKTNLRSAGTKIQTVSVDSATFTNQTEDTLAAGSNFLTAGSTQPVVYAPFNGGNTDLTWQAGGGATKIYGFTGSKVTENGADEPTVILSASTSGSGGSFASAGNYYYAYAYRKATTQAISNAAQDLLVNVATTSTSVNLTLTAAPDTTKYDKTYIYRSAVSGVSGFTTGDLVAIVDSSSVAYVDTGTYVDTVVLIPRAGNVDEDHSKLETGTYKNITTWKRRLVAVKESTAFISAFDNSEYWPVDSDVVIPSGGDIRASGIIGFNTPTSFNTDEKLCLWKDNELWEVSGTGFFDSTNNIFDYTLNYVDKTGCVSQSLVVNANGHVFWMNNNGVYMWTGSGKPIRLSRPIESSFEADGDIDKSKLTKGFGVYYAKENRIDWVVSDKIYGENRLVIRLDLRLTLNKRAQQVGETVEMDGVFILGKIPTALYAGLTYLPQTTPDESFIVGDSAGFLYKMYLDTANPNDTAIEFSYVTKNYDMELPSIQKEYHKVIVWLDDMSVTSELKLRYWANYRAATVDRSEIAESMDFEGNNAVALFDAGVFDVSLFDEYTPQVKPIVFNLKSDEGNNIGDSIKLEFYNNDTDSPIHMHGWSILWEPLNQSR